MASSSFPNYPTYPILPTAPPAPPSQSLPVPAGYGSVANYPPGYIYDLTQHRERSNYLVREFVSYNSTPLRAKCIGGCF